MSSIRAGKLAPAKSAKIAISAYPGDHLDERECSVFSYSFDSDTAGFCDAEYILRYSLHVCSI